MVKYQKTKTLITRDNGRSAHCTSPNFLLGCERLNGKDEGLQYCSYCYVKRWNRKAVYVNTNTDDILESINNWVKDKPFIAPISQISDNGRYYCDICCDTDLSVMWKQYNWLYVFDWFKNHPNLSATFATKFVNKNLLKYKPKNIRCRISLLPEEIQPIVEYGTSPINKRIKFIQQLVDAGYECHVNLSPIIIYGNDSKKHYVNLLRQIKQLPQYVLDQLKLECIFLTHHEGLHQNNLLNKFHTAEDLLWNPAMQESKVSQYGGNNLRYKWQMKNKLIEVFKKMVKEELNVPIRYIF